MNIITKAALSLSLIALIAQPAQAASYNARWHFIKKIGKIAFHAVEIKLGTKIYFGDLTVNSSNWSRETNPLSGYLIGTSLLYHGLKGLKKEICPDFNPISWVKNELNKETE